MRGMKRGTSLSQGVSIMGGRSFPTRQYRINRSDRWIEMRLLEIADPTVCAVGAVLVSSNSLIESVSPRDC